MAAPHTRALGIPHSELPRLCPARLPRYPLQTILRLLLFSRLPILWVHAISIVPAAMLWVLLRIGLDHMAAADFLPSASPVNCFRPDAAADRQLLDGPRTQVASATRWSRRYSTYLGNEMVLGCPGTQAACLIMSA
jgi:hypothetical protein